MFDDIEKWREWEEQFGPDGMSMARDMYWYARSLGVHPHPLEELEHTIELARKLKSVREVPASLRDD
jgi:hypothetical protein